MAQFHIYEDKASGFRWRLVADNGRIVADSGESYVSKSNVKRAIETFRELASSATVTEVKGGEDVGN